MPWLRPAVITPTPTHLAGGCVIGATKCTTITSEGESAAPEPVGPGFAVAFAADGREKPSSISSGAMAARTAPKKGPSCRIWLSAIRGIAIREYEVWNNADNRALLAKMGKAYQFEPSGVPVTFIGNQYWTGYSESIGQEIEESGQRLSDGFV